MNLPSIDSLMPRPLAPNPSKFSERFWTALAAGQFTTTQCSTCGHLTFPPRRYCPACGGDSPAWRVLSGRGRIYSRTRVHAAAGQFAWLAPYTVGIVDLEEGVRVLTRFLSDASELPLDAAVQLVVVRHSDGPLFAAASSQRSGSAAR